MRLFIGIFPPQDIISRIRDSIRKLDKIKRNLKFVPYDQMHITLKFLGNSVSDESYDKIVKSLNRITPSLSQIKISFDNIWFGFPGRRYPHVIFFTISKNKELDALSKTIHEEIKELKLLDTIRRMDNKKLINHLTIARTKHSISASFARNTRKLLQEFQVSDMSFVADEIILIRSDLTNTGPLYKKMARFKLSNLTI